MLRLAALAAALSLVAPANAAAEEDLSGPQLVLVGTDVVLPPLLLVADLVYRPTSRGYGNFEIVIGLSTGVVNSVVAANEPGDRTRFLAYTAIDLALVAHGAYLSFRPEHHTSVAVAPSVVSDGKTSAPGVSIGGAW